MCLNNDCKDNWTADYACKWLKWGRKIGWHEDVCCLKDDHVWRDLVLKPGAWTSLMYWQDLCKVKMSSLLCIMFSWRKWSYLWKKWQTFLLFKTDAEWALKVKKSKCCFIHGMLCLHLQLHLLWRPSSLLLTASSSFLRYFVSLGWSFISLICFLIVCRRCKKFART